MKNLDFRKYYLIIISSVLISFNVLAQSGAWTKKADLPKSGGSASFVDGKIFVIGGSVLPGITDVAHNVVYDPSANTWEEKASMPTARGFLFTAVVNDTIYAIGGGYPNYKLKVEAYDPVTNSWTTKKDMSKGHIGCNSSCVIDNIIYIVGGNYSERECWTYKPGTDEWTQKASMPSDAGGALSVTAYNGLIYTFGGSTDVPGVAKKTVYAYNPQTDTWTKKQDMPTARYAFQTYLINGKIYAMGGAPSGGVSLSTVEVYDPETDTWETKPNMPHNRAWFSGAVVNNKIYVIGGTPNELTSDYSVWKYDPSFHTEVAAGNVSGTWTLSNSPYHVNGEITIPNGETLTVEPGVEIVFTGHYKFNVQGRLLAVGTEQNPILLTAEDQTAGWHGVRFTNTQSTNDTSKFIYCSFKYGKANTGVYTGDDRRGGAIFIRGYSKILVSNSLFKSNMNDGEITVATGGPAIYIESASPLIKNNTFTNNEGTTDCSILCVHSNVSISNNIFSNNKGCHGPIFGLYNSPTISNNIIFNNVTTRAGGGIFTMSSNATIINNVIYNNSCFGVEGEGGGIKSWTNDKPIIINNTIVNNSGAHGGGFCCNDNANPILINNIILGNTSPDGNQVNLMDVNSDPYFYFNDIQGGKEGFEGPGAGTNYTGLYENNIDVDPLFANVSANDFRLKNVSQCIGAGTESLEINGTMYRCPAFCIMGVTRPSPAGSNPDIGAYENLLASPLVGVEEESTTPNEFALYQNYPNPFNPTTNLSFVIGHLSFVTLKVYDILGKEVETLVNEEKPAGTYEVTWNATNLTSGVYFFQLKASSYTETKKLLLLK
ncbi:MAG: kelch repeat-containing protein [Ignavibacteriaceae bacterium]